MNASIKIKPTPSVMIIRSMNSCKESKAMADFEETRYIKITQRLKYDHEFFLSMTQTVKQGDAVKVFYNGYFDDKVVFDSNIGKEPLIIKVGEGKLLKKFEDALIGMKEKDEKDIRIEAVQGYGMSREELFIEIPQDKLPREAPLKKGIVLTLVSPRGQRIFAKIEDIKEKTVVLDLNHPLAGKTLNFHIIVEAFA